MADNKITANAYNNLLQKGFLQDNDKELTSVSNKQKKEFKAKVNIWTNTDRKTHKYFHSFDIDSQIQDFMSTCELRAPYDSDLMAYWEPIRATCVVYGSNTGNTKVLFVGRVREVKQDGYELVVTLQNYGWKFQQNVTNTFAKDAVQGKDGYTIIRSIFDVLKIDSFVISPSAIRRLKQVGYDDDGVLTYNKGVKIEEMPDLFKRIEKTNPKSMVNNYTVYNKLKEDKLGNLYNINYTLRYEKPTPVMTKLAKENTYKSGGEKVSKKSEGSSDDSTTSGSGSSSSSKSANVSIKKLEAKGCKVNELKREAFSDLRTHVSTIYKVYEGVLETHSPEAKKAKEFLRVFLSKYPYMSNTLNKCILNLKHNGKNRTNCQFVFWPQKSEMTNKVTATNDSFTNNLLTVGRYFTNTWKKNSR